MLAFTPIPDHPGMSIKAARDDRSNNNIEEIQRANRSLVKDGASGRAAVNLRPPSFLALHSCCRGSSTCFARRPTCSVQSVVARQRIILLPSLMESLSAATHAEIIVLPTGT